MWPRETSIVHVKFMHGYVQSFDDGGNMTIEGCGLQALFCFSLVPRPFLYGRSGNYTSFVQLSVNKFSDSHQMAIECVLTHKNVPFGVHGRVAYDLHIN